MQWPGAWCWKRKKVNCSMGRGTGPRADVQLWLEHEAHGIVLRGDFGASQPCRPAQLFLVFQARGRCAVVAHPQFDLPDELIANEAAHAFDEQGQVLALRREAQVLLKA